MGKKKNKSIWDITPEEQMAKAELMYQIEIGEADVDDLFDVGYKEDNKRSKKDKINKNGLSSSIEKMIVKRSKADGYADEEDDNDLFGFGNGESMQEVKGWDVDEEESSNITNKQPEIKEEVNTSRSSFVHVVDTSAFQPSYFIGVIEAGAVKDTQTGNVVDMVDKNGDVITPESDKLYIDCLWQNSDGMTYYWGGAEIRYIPVSGEPSLSHAHSSNLRTIRITMHEELERASIDDGITPMSFLLNPTDDDVLITGAFTNDELVDYAVDLMTYAEMMQHPTAIFKEQEFKERTAHIRDFDHTKYIFGALNGWVFVWVVDNESFVKVTKYADNIDPSGMLNVRVFAGMAITSQFVTNCFFAEDNNYVDTMYSSKYNQRDEVIDSLNDDRYTDFADTKDSPTIRPIEMLDYYRKITSMMSGLVASDFTDDEEDDSYIDAAFDELERIAKEEGIDNEDDDDDDLDNGLDEDEDIEIPDSTIVDTDVDKDIKVNNTSNKSIGGGMEVISPDKKSNDSMIITPHKKPR